jgi:hypothetical protein
MSCRDALLVEKTLDLGEIFDLCIFIIVAGIPGKNVLAIGDLYTLRISEHSQRSGHLGGKRDGVVVRSEPNTGRPAKPDGHLFEQRIGMFSHRQQPQHVISKNLAHAAVLGSRTGVIRGFPEAIGLDLAPSRRSPHCQRGSSIGRQGSAPLYMPTRRAM